ncbi:MAG: type IV secretory system conjugative DNA transfer family protein [Caulobacter sp.]
MIAFCLAWPVASHAQDRDQITRGITYALTDNALIERERARADVPDDFAADMFALNRQRLSENYAAAERIGQGRAIRQEAERRANRTIGATLRTDYLRSFPDPQRVRSDLAASSGDVSDAELAGRQAGRMTMLANSLKGLQGETAEGRWPADVTQRIRIYWLNFHDLRDRMNPTFTDTCARWQFWCKTRGEVFNRARVHYEHDLERAQETATLYLPEGFRERFVDSTGVGGSRAGHKQYQAQLRDEREAAERAREIKKDGVSFRTLMPIIGSALLVLILISMMFTRNNRGGARPPLTDNHGSATWGAMNMDVHPLEPLFGVFLGKYAWPQHTDGQVKTPPVFTKPEAHTLIMAPTRTGKGTRIIVPTLLRYDGSMLVIDPKGENAAIAGRQRAELPGHKVHVLNPWGVLDDELAKRGLPTSRYNPLDAIQRGDPDAASIAHTMAESICARSGDPRNAYWEGSATAILTAVFLWLADNDSDREKKTLARVRQIVTLPQDRLEKEYFIPMAASTAYGGAIAENIGPFVSSGDSRDMPSILRTLAEATRFISDERLKEATSAISDFDLRTFPHRSETVFLVIPPDRMKAQATWLRLMLAAFAHAFRTAKPRGQIRGMMLIDELPALGKIPDLPTDLATMSGYGLDYTLIVQDMGQLKATYGEESRTILANCGWKWLCNVRDYDTAKYVSDTLGQRTVGTATVNEGQTGQGEATSGKAYGEMGRSLLTPDEVMQLGRDRAIVLPPAGRPFQIWGVDYWTIRDEFLPYREGAMQLYYSHPLVIDPNPYRQGADGQEQAAK